MPCGRSIPQDDGTSRENRLRIDLDSFFQAVAPLVSGARMDDEAVGNTFRTLMSTLMTFDYVVVFAYRGKERPLDLYSTFDAEDHGEELA